MVKPVGMFIVSLPPESEIRLYPGACNVDGVAAVSRYRMVPFPEDDGVVARAGKIGALARSGKIKNLIDIRTRGIRIIRAVEIDRVTDQGCEIGRGTIALNKRIDLIAAGSELV
jgi:hypothetical protein